MAFQLAGTKRLGSKVSRSGQEVRVSYDLTEGQAIVITYRPDVDFLEHPAGTGFFLPASFEYLTVRHELPYAVTMAVGVLAGHSPQVNSITVSRKGRTEIGQLGDRGEALYAGPPVIKSDALRTIPVGRLLRDAVRAATHTAPGYDGVPDLMVREKDIVESWRTVVRGELLPRGTSPNYEEVARVYRSAVVAGEPPTKAVADAFSVAMPTAGRYVMEARTRNFLGPAPGPGRSGEIKSPKRKGRGKR